MTISSAAGASVEEAKQYGAFYTPPMIVDFLIEWGIRSRSDRVLEPAAGEGVFVAAAAARIRSFGSAPRRNQLIAIEKRASEAAKIEAARLGASVRSADFFEVAPSDLPRATAVIGNPPFIRFHRFTGRSRELGLERARAEDVELSQLASSWAHFVVHACAFMEPEAGRLGLVLPAEILHADYAEPIRQFLVRRFSSVTILAFDQRAFHPALVDAVLLLADQAGPGGLHIWRLTDQNQLSQDVLLGRRPWPADARRWSAGIHPAHAKLYGVLAEDPNFCRLGTVASVDIGVVTGANAFFILNEARRAELELDQEALSPIVQRGRDLGGLAVMESETQWLLDLRERQGDARRPAVAAYLKQGVKAGVPNGYKCSGRSPWWAVPLPKHRPDLLLSYMHYGSPRLIANPQRHRSTNLVHGVRLLDGAPDARALAAASLSAATAYSAEVEGRVYGGGVLKLETREAERLFVPALTKAKEKELLAEFAELDALVRADRRAAASQRVDEILGVKHADYLAAATSFQDRRRGLARGRHPTRDPGAQSSTTSDARED